MTRSRQGVLCERARSWAALAPDNELSELEHRLLGAQLTRCPGCSRFAEQVAAVSRALRNAPLEPLTYPVSVPSWRRRGAFARIQAVSAAAAVAAMALGIAARAPLPSEGRGEAFRLPGVVAGAMDERREMDQLREFRRDLLVGAARALGGRHFGDQPA